MNNGTSPAKGYYSILQYVPDLERAEGVNIGVVLFCPEKGFLKAQTAAGNDRVRRFFSREANIELDLDRINVFKTAFEERIELEAGRIRTLDDFRHFVNTRANCLLLTEPKPMKVFDPNEELQSLFERLVGGRRRRLQKRAASTKEELIQRFSNLLVQRRIEEKVEREVRIESQLFDRTFVFPFAFRNGSLNVIDPVSFEAAKERNIDRACQLAVEGSELLQLPQPVSLNVLGSFDHSEGIEQVQAVLQKFRVKLYTADDLTSLIAEIERAH